VTARLRSSRRVANLVVAISLLGACAVLVVLVESPGGSTVAGKSGPVQRPRRAAAAALLPLALGHSSALSPARRESAPLTPEDTAGLRLMTEAAAACESVAFRGTQVTAWWGQSGGGASVLQVWHRPGTAILARSASTAARSPDERPLDPAGLPDQNEVMTITPPLLTLLRANYQLTYTGSGTADGRPAEVVEVRRHDGSLAARFWLDVATKLPLRRELFDADAAIFSEDAYIGLSVGADQLGDMPSADVLPWAGQLTADGLAALQSNGWPVHSALAGGLTLFAATETVTASGKVAELSYSDGLSIISVFLQRGELPRSMPGWRQIEPGGSDVYAVDSDDRSLAWSAGGFVYTVISDAPAATVSRAVVGLPHDSSPGFWERIGRGFRRMASWFNPFG
jgi:sigma-E factor negative regulatory protein RseB